MKKQLYTTLACAILIATISGCASSNNQTNTRSEPKTIKVNTEDFVDTYDETESVSDEDVETADEYIDSEYIDAKTPNKSKKKGRFSDILTFGNKNQFAIIDSTSVYEKNLTGSLVTKKSNVTIDLEKKTAGFGSNYLTQYYIVQMDKENRAKFAQAYQSYLRDFDNKKLIRKSKKTFKAYGKIQIHLDWGTLNTSTPNNADGEAYLGYEFVKNSPYFTLSNYPFENNYRKVVGDSAQRESLNLKYYFTKAQAKELIEMLNENTIAEYCGDYISDTNIKPVEADEY